MSTITALLVPDTLIRGVAVAGLGSDYDSDDLVRSRVWPEQELLDVVGWSVRAPEPGLPDQPEGQVYGKDQEGRLVRVDGFFIWGGTRLERFVLPGQGVFGDFPYSGAVTAAAIMIAVDPLHVPYAQLVPEGVKKFLGSRFALYACRLVTSADIPEGAPLHEIRTVEFTPRLTSTAAKLFSLIQDAGLRRDTPAVLTYPHLSELYKLWLVSGGDPTTRITPASMPYGASSPASTPSLSSSQVFHSISLSCGQCPGRKHLAYLDRWPMSWVVRQETSQPDLYVVRCPCGYRLDLCEVMVQVWLEFNLRKHERPKRLQIKAYNRWNKPDNSGIWKYLLGGSRTYDPLYHYERLNEDGYYGGAPEQ